MSLDGLFKTLILTLVLVLQASESVVNTWGAVLHFLYNIPREGNIADISVFQKKTSWFCFFFSSVF